MPPDEEKSVVILPRGAVYILAAMFLLFLILLITIPLVMHFGRRCPNNGVNATEETEEQKKSIRLPRNFLPIRYWLSLKVYLPASDVVLDPSREFSFDGNVTILMECLERTTNVTLHVHRVNISRETFRFVQMRTDETPGPDVGLTSVVQSSKNQQISFMLNQTLSKGTRYRLFLSYRGELADDLAGFYRSSYDENGEKR